MVDSSFIQSSHRLLGGNFMLNKQAESTWWQTFYDDAMQVVLQDQSCDKIEKESALMIQLTGLQPGQAEPSQSVFDQCCGLGQHAMELAKTGFHVTGLDQSSEYISSATQAAEENDLNVQFLTGDALHTVLDQKVDAVINWHSSFGYCADDQSNLKMLRAAYESLKPDGRMLLEFPNMVHLLANFQAVIETTLPCGTKLVRHSRIEMNDETLRQIWYYGFANGESREHQSLMRIYLPTQIVTLLRAAGFGDVRIFAGDGRELSPDSPRLIALATRVS